jgi:hypothetical protein
MPLKGGAVCVVTFVSPFPVRIDILINSQPTLFLHRMSQLAKMRASLFLNLLDTASGEDSRQKARPERLLRLVDVISVNRRVTNNIKSIC